jgi:dTDP-4-amino-4,6-dideoxygalactose transaminase
MLNAPFSPWPSYTQEEADAISETLLSNRVNYWTGDECRQFEKEFANWVQCDYAIALGNGTQALELALKAPNIGIGDEVIVTSRSFINPEHLKADWNRDKLLAVINEKGVPCYTGSCAEIYQEHAFDDTTWRPQERCSWFTLR